MVVSLGGSAKAHWAHRAEPIAGTRDPIRSVFRRRVLGINGY